MLDNTQFFCDVLDTTIPALAEARQAFLDGDEPLAEKRFADYVRETMDTEAFLSLDFVDEFCPNDPDYLRAAAEDICGLKLEACGFPYQFPESKVDWSFNPTPNQYCEWVWQFNRFEMLVELSKAYRLYHDDRYVTTFRYLMESWIDQQPCPIAKMENRGGSFEHVGWRTIEIGIRFLATWPMGICTFIKCEALSDSFVVKVFRSVWEQGFCLRHFNTDHNWLIMEMLGLFTLTCAFPFYRMSGRWRQYSLERMVEQLDEQFYPEGFQYELTTGYHLGVAADYLKFVSVASAYGVKIPRKMTDRIHKMYTVILKLLQPNGQFPGLNDGSDGALADRLAIPTKVFPEDKELLWAYTAGREGCVPTYRSLVLPTAGYAVMRTGWDRQDIWALFDSAHYGWGHQHEDKLAFLLYAYGKPLLTDSGNYEYDTSDMRAFVLSSRSHNTGLVDTFGQNRGATFSIPNEERIVKESIPSDLSWSLGGDVYECAEGEYARGYGDALIQVTHHRKVIFFKKGLPGTLPFFVLLDRFTPMDGQEHLYEVLFQLGTQPIVHQDSTVTADHGDGVTLSLIGSAPVNILTAQYKPRYMGWRKRHAPGTDHEHYPAPAVLFTQRGGETRMATVIYPNREAGLPIAAVEAPPHGDGSFTIRLADGTAYTFREDAAEFATFDGNGAGGPTDPDLL